VLSTPSPQLPLRLRCPPDQRLETFVGADHATALLAALATGTGPSAIYLAGASGTGKTHLLLAAAAHAQELGRKVAYLPLAAAAGRLDKALDALEHADLIALDGLDAVIGRHEDEIALFHLHNRLSDAGKRVCYSATCAPDTWPAMLPDLRSRLNQCTRIFLTALDDAGRSEVLRRRAVRRGLQIDPAAIDWLLRRFDRDLVNLTELLDHLDRASLAEQRRVTVPFLRRVVQVERASPQAAPDAPGYRRRSTRPDGALR